MTHGLFFHKFAELKSTFKNFRLLAADDQNQAEKPKPRNPSSNIDLFAAGERKIKAPINVSVTSTVAKPEVIANKAVDAVKPLNTAENVQIGATTSVAAPSSSRNSMIELQAELLRLEAEKEQLEIDQLRLDEEKVSKLTQRNVL